MKLKTITISKRLTHQYNSTELTESYEIEDMDTRSVREIEIELSQKMTHTLNIMGMCQGILTKDDARSRNEHSQKVHEILLEKVRSVSQGENAQGSTSGETSFPFKGNDGRSGFPDGS